jgi:FAD synthase
MKLASLKGVVTKYKGNGRKLGYPTANISTDTDLKDGVYFGFADLAEFNNNPALIFIGTPTTVGDTDRRAEAYLLNIPDVDYYEQTLNVEILHFHRPNKTFNSIEDLKKVMLDDEKQARAWFLDLSSGNDRS